MIYTLCYCCYYYCCYCAEQFEATATKEQVKSLRANPRAMRRLQTACENTKRALSSAPSAQVLPATIDITLMPYITATVSVIKCVLLRVKQHTLHTAYTVALVTPHVAH
jgi:molecular chaperone DnaK (HSP70)